VLPYCPVVMFFFSFLLIVIVYAVGKYAMMMIMMVMMMVVAELCAMCNGFRWYFGKIKRIEAEKILLQAANESGAFLIRDSESRRNDFSLSSMLCYITCRSTN